MRLIDANALIDELREDLEWAQEEGRKEMYGVKLALKRAQKAPTIEAEPVRHGRWIQQDDGEPYCSECREENESMMFRPYFCPICGAKMDEGGAER